MVSIVLCISTLQTYIREQLLSTDDERTSSNIVWLCQPDLVKQQKFLYSRWRMHPVAFIQSTIDQVHLNETILYRQFDTNYISTYTVRKVLAQCRPAEHYNQSIAEIGDTLGNGIKPSIFGLNYNAQAGE